MMLTSSQYGLRRASRQNKTFPQNMRLIHLENNVERAKLDSVSINELSCTIQMVKTERCRWDKNVIR